MPKRAAAVAILWPGLPAAAAACPYCFGASDNPNAPKAFFIGALILIGCTFGALAGLVAVARRIEAARTALERKAAEAPQSRRSPA